MKNWNVYVRVPQYNQKWTLAMRNVQLDNAINAVRQWAYLREGAVQARIQNHE